jgi:hypothetical protein
MALFHRPDRPPAEIVAQVPKHERIVSWADTEDGAHVLATPAGLWWPVEGGQLRLIGWQHIDKAIWRDGVLTVIEADVVDDLLLVERPPVAVRLSVARDLPPTVRKRVEANIVHSQVQPVSGGSARLVARRVPGHDGLVWWARVENGLPVDERVRAQLEDRIAELRAADAAATG